MPRIPRVGPGEVVPLVRVRPEDVGGGGGQAAFSDTAQTLGALSDRLIAAEREGAVSRAEAGVAAELGELVQRVEQLPDADAREPAFETESKAIQQKFRQGLRGAQYQTSFDDRVFQHATRAKHAVREGVNRKRLDNARGAVIESVDKYDRMIEQSEPGPLRDGYIFARANNLDAGVSGGAISAAERAQIDVRSSTTFEAAAERRTLGGIRAAIRNDPAQAYRDLQEPTSPLASGLDEFQRQVAIDQAITEHTQGLAQDRAAYTFARSEQDRRDREQAEEARKGLDDMLVNGDLAGVQQALPEVRSVLTPEDYRFYLNRIASGGGLEDLNAQTVPEVYSDLFSRAAAGEPIARDADAAYRRGQLTIDRRDSLIKSSEERRFGAAERFLYEKLRVGEAVENMTGKALSAEAGAAMIQWRQRNPDATDEEAMAKARELGSRYSIIEMDEIAATYPAPAFAVGQRYAYDIPATEAAINAHFMRKHGLEPGTPLDALLTDPEYGEAMELLERWQKAQQDRAREMALQQAAKDAARGK